MPPSLEDPGKQERSYTGIPVVPAFDGYRALAVAAIVLFHLLAASGLLVRAGESVPARLVWGTLPYAVVIFFVVSGFVLYLPTAARNGEFGRLWTFALRRGARLFPAFWLALAIALLALVLTPKATLPMPSLDEIGLNLTGLQGWATLFDAGEKTGFGVNTVLWTLTIEIGFYILLPFVATAYFRHPLIGLAIAAAITILWREAFEHLNVIADLLGTSLTPERAIALQFADNQLPLWTFAFGAGMTGAWAYVRLHEGFDREQVERVAVRVAVVGAVALCACIYLAGRYAIGNPATVVILLAWDSWPLMIAYTAVLATLMVSIALGPEGLQRPFTLRPVRTLADISFGVYLIHVILLWFILVQFTPEGSVLTNFAILFVAVVPASLAYGYLSARFVEQPVRRWSQRHGRRSKAKRAAKAAAAG